MNRAICSVCILIVAFAAAGSGDAATYYVDFDGGSDTNAGTSAAAPFKHCPGDAAATGAAKITYFAAGDTVIFKGGVHYRGIVVVSRAGGPDNLIVYDGNTAGTFGTGRAVIDGADPVTGWTQCQSAAEVNGNPHYASIYWAYIPAPSHDLWHVNLCEGVQTLPIAQDPNPSDAFYQDRIDTYRRIREKTVL